MVTNARAKILDGALELLRVENGGSITLDAAAKQVGLTKPGLMYHFPTKEALMLGVVDHVAARWERKLIDHLGCEPQQASATQRIASYVEVALTGSFDRADFAICADAVYHPALTTTWVARFEPWLALPPELSAAQRARLTAARLLADGYWTAAATGVFPVPEHERAALLAVVRDLLKGTNP
ncbi:TetR/AcrR family transcriptional regulator [Nocardia sp. NPDC057668]|uniref:TetR/AcrR family transcriptional regulator n=1 Tax=Nocardia sp. NPDC057668 TaxID=3346202 RepID=UPI0036721AB0